MPHAIHAAQALWKAWAKDVGGTAYAGKAAQQRLRFPAIDLVRPELENLTGYRELHTREDAFDALRTMPVDAVPTQAVFALLECDVWGGNETTPEELNV